MEKKNCESCGMPMVKDLDFGGNNRENPYCVHCCDENGQLKSYEAVMEGMTEFAMKMMGSSYETAKETARENMSKMPAWMNRG